MTRISFDGCVILRCADKHRNKTYILFEDDFTVFSGTIVISASEICTNAELLLLIEVKNLRRKCILRWYGIYPKFNTNKPIVAEVIWGENYAHTGKILVQLSLERSVNWKKIYRSP
jgi:hypothetical protein